jgi:hypothetical protein
MADYQIDEEGNVCFQGQNIRYSIDKIVRYKIQAEYMALRLTDADDEDEFVITSDTETILEYLALGPMHTGTPDWEQFSPLWGRYYEEIERRCLPMHPDAPLVEIPLDDFKEICDDAYMQVSKNFAGGEYDDLFEEEEEDEDEDEDEDEEEDEDED